MGEVSIAFAGKQGSRAGLPRAGLGRARARAELILDAPRRSCRDAAGTCGRPAGRQLRGFHRPGAPREWLRRNLFSSFSNTLLTLLVVALFVLAVPPVFNWAVTDATISGDSRAACTGSGACWTFIKLRLHTFLWGHYPDSELWRVGVAALLLVLFSVPVMRDNIRHRAIYLLLLLTVFPFLAALLLVGGVLGLPEVDTSDWGGLMLDVIISFVTVAGALPLGILLALGRRSQLGVVKYLSIAFIELWRSVPLLTVLFMSAVMLPLFLPHGISIDRLIRAMVAFTLFNAAYMAETVRGGLQGVPVGEEGAAVSPRARLLARARLRGPAAGLAHRGAGHRQ